VQVAERPRQSSRQQRRQRQGEQHRRRAAQRQRAPGRQFRRHQRVLVDGDGEHAQAMPLVVLQRRVAGGEQASVRRNLDDARDAFEQHRARHVGRRAEADLAPPVDGDERRGRRRVALVDHHVGGELRLQAIGELGVERH
jgi:hypothetical protein